MPTFLHKKIYLGGMAFAVPPKIYYRAFFYLFSNIYGVILHNISNIYIENIEQICYYTIEPFFVESLRRFLTTNITHTQKTATYS